MSNLLASPITIASKNNKLKLYKTMCDSSLCSILKDNMDRLSSLNNNNYIESLGYKADCICQDAVDKFAATVPYPISPDEDDIYEQCVCKTIIIN